MPYTKEQLRTTYWQTHKEQINFQRREKRRLAKLINKPVSHITANPKTANLPEVSHGKPTSSKPNLEMAQPALAFLIKEWQTATNYSCFPTCLYSYCSNC